MLNKDVLTPTYGTTSRQYVLAPATSVQSNQFAEDCYAVVTVDSVTFVRTADPGVTPTALGNGTDHILLANTATRMGPFRTGQRLAFFSTIGGNAYVTPSV